MGIIHGPSLLTLLRLCCGGKVFGEYFFHVLPSTEASKYIVTLLEPSLTLLFEIVNIQNIV